VLATASGGADKRGRVLTLTLLQMSVLMLMLAGSDTSKMSHKVLLGVLPDLPQPVIDRVRALAVNSAALTASRRVLLGVLPGLMAAHDQQGAHPCMYASPAVLSWSLLPRRSTQAGTAASGRPACLHQTTSGNRTSLFSGTSWLALSSCPPTRGSRQQGRTLRWRRPAGVPGAAQTRGRARAGSAALLAPACAHLTGASFAPQMREEQREVVARHGPALTRGALADMRWADAMAREVLRLRGPAEGLFRCGPAALPVGSSLTAVPRRLGCLRG